MLTIYETKSGALKAQTGQPRVTEQAIWIDLLNPTQEEEAKIERALKIDVPTREEQEEIEVSSRLYQEDGAYFMTATLLYQPQEGEPRMTPVTFILAGQRLVTVRYAEPRAFAIYVARCNRSETELKAGTSVLIGLIETIVDRLADFIERVQAEVEGLSHSASTSSCGRSAAKAR
jgi:magnesium transporter